MNYWNGQFTTTGNFSLYTENTNNGWVEMEGTVDAVCDWERGDRDTPGSVDYDVDYDSTSVWGDVGWIDEQGDTHSLTVRFDGADADAGHAPKRGVPCRALYGSDHGPHRGDSHAPWPVR